MPRNDKGELTGIDVHDVGAALVEAIEFDASTSTDVGGSGVFTANQLTPIHGHDGDGTTLVYVVKASDDSLWRVTVAPES